MTAPVSNRHQRQVQRRQGRSCSHRCIALRAVASRGSGSDSRAFALFSAHSLRRQRHVGQIPDKVRGAAVWLRTADPTNFTRFYAAGNTKVVAYGSDPATCPVRTLQDWLELAGIGEGPVFRPINRHEQLDERRLTDHAVADILKRVAKRAGMKTQLLSGHSLRAGFVTSAKQNGADDAAIMDQTGHKSLAMVHRYHRRPRKWHRPASAKLGL